MRSFAFASLTAWLALLAGEADAHIQLMSPTQRHSAQKAGPCGVGADDARGPNVTTFEPGEKIVVVFDEHVDHPGHFRISFDADGHDDFADPQAYDDFYTNEAVLLDDIADKDGGIYEVEVTLPDVECDNCTLQVQQTMTDKPPFGPGGGVDFYWQCADIRLEYAAGTSTSGEPGTTGGGEGTAGEETGGEASTGGGEATANEATSGGETAGPDEDPTTSPGPNATTGDATTGDATSTTDPADPGVDKGCGCRGDAGGVGGLALLLPLVWRRRRG